MRNRIQYIAVALGFIFFILVGFIIPHQVVAQGQEVFQSSLLTGSATYTIPIAVPPGTNGMQPNLALVYNSDGGNGWLGVGWDLAGLGYIERLGPNYSPAPAPTNPASDTYRLSFGGSQKLVRDSSVPGNFYRTQIESFLKIEYIPNNCTGTSDSCWVVTDRGGTKFYFGQTTVSRLGVGDLLSRWYLDKVLDPHGTYWTVEYLTDTGGDIYPQRIVYTQGGPQGQTLSCMPSNLNTCRVVDFILNNPADPNDLRLDPLSSYRTGAEIISDRRLKAIEVRLGNQLFRTYALDYLPQASPTARGYAPISQLRKVTETGAGSNSSFVTTLAYNVDVNGNSLTLNQFVLGGPTEDLGGAPGTPGACTFTIDMDGDGDADVLVGNGGSNSYYYPNTTGDGTPSVWGAIKAVRDPSFSLPSLCSTRSEQQVVFNRAMPPFDPNPGVETFDVVIPVHDTAVVDLNGDRLPDIVDGKNDANGWGWWQNQGPDPNGEIIFSNRMNLSNAPNISIDDTNSVQWCNSQGCLLLPTRGIDFVDLDSDGLPDIVQLQKTQSEPPGTSRST